MEPIIQRLDHDAANQTEVAGCLEVIAEAFAPMHNTPMYVEDPGAHGHAFWRSMAQEILYGLKPNPQHPPLYVIPDRAPQAATASAGNSHHSYQQSQPHQPQQQPQLQPQQLPAAAALAYVWRPDVGAFNMPATEAMLRAEAVPDWEACGELWHRLLLEVYQQHGEVINVDFIAVRPRHQHGSGGHGRALLAAILADADAAGRAVFLAACGPTNAAWYERHGFVLRHHYTCELPGVPGHADLSFQVRPPRPLAGKEREQR
ncbi:hypothetical protein CHLRE_06g273350v5 [Chlamydomonas reinhardtii]|uniref:N-acetyltransferase domain-containing protein n=1 Tax=Chlamydomonas reinhardtii TaxID=3055 RepID=A0A2K3DNJ0_CHLRE|nr:uncharacterized protein CHLRE_06g273350v5 [Chlamydomonas reinhardtii]PNW82088.1 hypothetical protein CHLRE_06g273350v5 [Chlamydomonas reinhardtii]